MSQNEPHIIYEDKNFLAVYKPAGLLIHPIAAKRESQIAKREPTLTDWLVENFPEVKNVGDPSTSSGQVNLRPGLVHRLDKEVSGVVVVARNQKYFEYLKNLFQTRDIKKIYLALVYGEVKQKTGVINKPISIKSGTIKRTVWQGKDEKEAVTEFKVIKTLIIADSDADKHGLNISENQRSNQRKSATFSLLKVTPKTGRTHQIRIHLSSINHPIVGDALYGPKTNPFGLKRIFLHAESLEFSPSEGKRIIVESELPDELKNILESANT